MKQIVNVISSVDVHLFHSIVIGSHGEFDTMLDIVFTQ